MGQTPPDKRVGGEREGEGRRKEGGKGGKREWESRKGRGNETSGQEREEKNKEKNKQKKTNKKTQEKEWEEKKERIQKDGGRSSDAGQNKETRSSVETKELLS